MLSKTKNLEVWQLAFDLCKQILLISQTRPGRDFFIIDQINRSALSVPANIAEGHSRSSTKEFIYFLIIARSSLNELDTHLLISNEVYENLYSPKIFEAIEIISMKLNKLIKVLREKSNQTPNSRF